jgi:hypothetical protein
VRVAEKMISVFPKKRSNLIEREVDSEMVVFDPQNEKIHQLNTAASYIWNLCDGATSISGIAEMLSCTFDVSQKRAQRDVENIILDLKRSCLVELEKREVDFV